MANAKSLETIKKEIVNLVADGKLKEAKSNISNLIDAIKSVDDLTEVRATIEKVHLADSGIKPKEDLIKIYDKIVSCIKSNDYISAKKYIAETKKGVKFKKDVEVNLIKSVEKLVKLFYEDNPEQEQTDSEKEKDNTDLEDVSKSKLLEDIISEIVELYEKALNNRTKLSKILVKLKSEILEKLSYNDITKENFSEVIKLILLPLIYSSIYKTGLDEFKSSMKAQIQMLLSEDDIDDNDAKFIQSLQTEFGISNEDSIDEQLAKYTDIKSLSEKIMDLYFNNDIIKGYFENVVRDNGDIIFESYNALLYGESAVDYLSKCVTENTFEPANKYLNEIISEIGATNIILKNPDFVIFNSSLLFSINIGDDEFVKNHYISRMKDCVINKSDENVINFFKKYEIGSETIEEEQDKHTHDNPDLTKEDEENPYDDILKILK